MRIYEFHFYDQEGRRPTLDFPDCHSDGESAREAFRTLKQHHSCRGVEVYEGKRLVVRVELAKTSPQPGQASIHGAG